LARLKVIFSIGAECGPPGSIAGSLATFTSFTILPRGPGREAGAFSHSQRLWPSSPRRDLCFGNDLTYFFVAEWRAEDVHADVAPCLD
jgi:hypothetical protein